MNIKFLEQFIKLFEETKRNYIKTKDADALCASLENISELYGEYLGIGDLLLQYGEDIIDSEGADIGFEIIRIVEKYFKTVANQTLLCIRLAEWEFERGNAEKGKEYLERLVSKVDNYEESIEVNGLTDVWNKYKANLTLPKSIRFMKRSPLSPDECTICIEEILKLPQDDTLISELSTHLNELCGYGEQINIFSEAEQTVFYINEFIEDINSDGISHYLYYRGNHFQELFASVKKVNCASCRTLLDMIAGKFPHSKISSDIEKIKTHLECMEDHGVDFDAEEQIYYEQVEAELTKALLSYVANHADDFR